MQIYLCPPDVQYDIMCKGSIAAFSGILPHYKVYTYYKVSGQYNNFLLLLFGRVMTSFRSDVSVTENKPIETAANYMLNTEYMSVITTKFN